MTSSPKWRRSVVKRLDISTNSVATVENVFQSEAAELLTDRGSLDQADRHDVERKGDNVPRDVSDRAAGEISETESRQTSHASIENQERNNQQLGKNVNSGEPEVHLNIQNSRPSKQEIISNAEEQNFDHLRRRLLVTYPSDKTCSTILDLGKEKKSPDEILTVGDKISKDISKAVELTKQLLKCEVRLTRIDDTNISMYLPEAVLRQKEVVCADESNVGDDSGSRSSSTVYLTDTESRARLLASDPPKENQKSPAGESSCSTIVLEEQTRPGGSASNGGGGSPLRGTRRSRKTVSQRENRSFLSRNFVNRRNLRNFVSSDSDSEIEPSDNSQSRRSKKATGKVIAKHSKKKSSQGTTKTASKGSDEFDSAKYSEKNSNRRANNSDFEPDSEATTDIEGQQREPQADSSDEILSQDDEASPIPRNSSSQEESGEDAESAKSGQTLEDSTYILDLTQALVEGCTSTGGTKSYKTFML